MLFKENRGLKVEEEFVRSIVNFLTDKGWVKEDLKITEGIFYSFLIFFNLPLASTFSTLE